MKIKSFLERKSTGRTQTMIQQWINNKEEKTMFKSLMVIGGLVTSVLAMSSSNANAQFFNGGGWFGFSTLTGLIDLRGVPNPDSKPTVVVVDASLNQIEILCKNPNGFSVAPGSASQRFVLSHPIESQEVAKNGQAQVTIEFDLGDSESSINCNNKWTVIQNSAAVTDMSVVLQVFRCTGNVKTDPEPCVANDGITLTIEATPRDTFAQHCTLDPVLRNGDGTTKSGQFLTCVETPS
jgi:hypothetical protein